MPEELQRAGVAPDENAQRRVGTLLDGKYSIERVLGIGGTATVYAASNDIGHHVAIKVLHERLAFDLQAERHFLKEEVLSNTVHHRAVVQVISHGLTEDGNAYLVMPLIIGETLRQRAGRHGGRLSLAEVVKIGCAVLDALTTAHSEQIAHCDIKPDNVMLTEDGDVRILDFGIARIFASESEFTAGQCPHGTGTPAYMPPEQAAGKKRDFDGRTDTYATAAMMFRLISGRHIHHGIESPAKLLSVAQTQPALRLADVAPDVPARIARVIDKALSFEMAERWPSAQEMRDELEKALTEVLENSASARSRLPVRQTLVFRGMVASVVVVVAIGVAFRSGRTLSSHGLVSPATARGPLIEQDPRMEAGIRLWMRGASSLAREQFAKASEANPADSRPNALFWAVSETIDHSAREHARAAQRGALSDFDAELVDALRPLTAEPPAIREATKPLRTLVDHHPHERVALLAYAAQLLRAHEYETALQLAESLGTSGSKIGFWLAGRAQKAMGRTDEARQSLRQCIEAAPDATDCLEALADLELDNGACLEGANTARDLTALNPDSPMAVWLHANAELGLTGSVARARAIVDGWSARIHGDYPAQAAAYDYALSVLEGDFGRASKAVKQWERAVASSSDALAHGAVMLAKFDLNRELGQGSSAAADARELAIHSNVWPSRDEFDFPIEAARALYLTSQLSRSQFIAARNEAIVREETYSAYRSTPLRRWLDTYAENILSHADAKDAIAAAPSRDLRGSKGEQPSVDATLGRLYLLGGNIDEAIAHLKRATTTCAPMEAPFDYVRSFQWLGEALGRKGKRADACAAFATVRKHWRANSRSKTAAEATRQAKGYRCSLNEVAVLSFTSPGAH